MLNIIREENNRRKDGKNLSIIKEQEEFETAEVENEVADGDETDLDDAERKEEEDKFKQTVHPRCKFERFKLYPNAQNVEFSGEILDLGLNWEFSLDTTTGVYITNVNKLQLTNETLEIIKKLVGYYKTWADEWANRISDEYKSQEDTGFEPGDDLPDEDEMTV
jgi:hypothetical protein